MGLHGGEGPECAKAAGRLEEDQASGKLCPERRPRQCPSTAGLPRSQGKPAVRDVGPDRQGVVQEPWH